MPDPLPLLAVFQDVWVQEYVGVRVAEPLLPDQVLPLALPVIVYVEAEPVVLPALIAGCTCKSSPAYFVWLAGAVPCPLAL